MFSGDRERVHWVQMVNRKLSLDIGNDHEVCSRNYPFQMRI